VYLIKFGTCKNADFSFFMFGAVLMGVFDVRQAAVMTADGTKIYVAAYDSHTVATFFVEADTGCLSLLSKILRSVLFLLSAVFSPPFSFVLVPS
jgi:hypothetical protein